jgi:ribosomal protein S18 acetylase RimI-like enzyme
MPITTATKQDIASLVALMDGAYRGEPSTKGWANEGHLFVGNKRTDEETVTELMEIPGAVFLKYINNEGAIEGCVFLQKKLSRLYLGMLSVSPGAQAKGIGKQLLKAAEEQARIQNCSSIYMTVITVRDNLIAWYERHGYIKTGEVLPFPVEEKFGIPTQPLELFILEKNI